jgi:hypothetical protein
MKAFLIIGFPLTLAGAFGLYEYFTGNDALNFAGNCNPYATASSCDNISIGYLIIGLVCGLIGLLFMMMGPLSNRAMASEQRFMQRARPGTARIISIDQPMNAEFNNQPLLTIELDVTPDGMPSYQHTIRTAVSALVMSQVKLTPGSELPVKIDPDKPTNLRIDWTAAALHQSQEPVSASQS